MYRSAALINQRKNVTAFGFLSAYHSNGESPPDKIPAQRPELIILLTLPLDLALIIVGGVASFVITRSYLIVKVCDSQRI